MGRKSGMTGDAERRKRRKAAEAAAVSVEPTGATEAPEPPAAPDNSPEREVEPAAPDAQALATGAAARRRRAWCPTAQEPSTINHYHGCHRRRLRSSSPRPRSDLVPRLSSLQQRRGPRQGVQRRRAGGRGGPATGSLPPPTAPGPCTRRRLAAAYPRLRATRWGSRPKRARLLDFRTLSCAPREISK